MHSRESTQEGGAASDAGCLALTAPACNCPLVRLASWTRPAAYLCLPTSRCRKLPRALTYCQVQKSEADLTHKRLKLLRGEEPRYWRQPQAGRYELTKRVGEVCEHIGSAGYASRTLSTEEEQKQCKGLEIVLRLQETRTSSYVQDTCTTGAQIECAVQQAGSCLAECCRAFCLIASSVGKAQHGLISTACLLKPAAGTVACSTGYWNSLFHEVRPPLLQPG